MKNQQTKLQRTSRTTCSNEPNKAHPGTARQPQGIYIDDIEVANYCDKLKANADKLAEALRDCLDVMERVHGLTLPVHLGAFCEEQDWSNAVRKARQVRADYERSAQ